MRELVALIVLGSVVWVVIDAHRIGVRKGLISGLGNMGPWGWFFCCLFLWYIAIPFYLIKRGELKMKAQEADRSSAKNEKLQKQSNSIERLEKLADLKNRGILSEEEFEKKKRETLQTV